MKRLIYSYPDSYYTPLSITNELTGETYTYHRNHQESITHLTNEEGQSIERFTYDAYGTILAYSQEEEHPKGISSQAQGTFNPYCYTAREFDVSQGSDNRPCLAVHGLYYYRARYYDARIGRFISSDPIEFQAGDFNFYRYVGNDPVNFVDPSGLAGLPHGRAKSGKGKKGEYNVVAENSKAVTNILESIFGKQKAQPREGVNSSGSGIKITYSSIKKSPNYPKDFKAVKNGTTKHNVKNKELLDKLHKEEQGKWSKIYKDGYDSKGNPVSVHYFQSQSGKVFNVKTKQGHSNGY